MLLLAWIENFFAALAAEKFERHHALSRLDGILAAFFIVLAMAEVIWLMEIIGTPLWSATALNLWFEADTARVIANWTDLNSDQYRTKVHPLTPTMLTVPVVILELLGMPWSTAAKTLMVFVAGVSGGLCFLILRLLDLPRLAACVFAGVFLGSASFIHWSPVPELNSAAMVTILVAIAILLEGGVRSTWVWVLAGAGTMGVTITNWTVGVIAAVVSLGVRQAMRIAAVTFGLVFVVAVAQSFVFKNSRLLTPKIIGEYQWTQVAAEVSGSGTWDPVASVRSLFVTTVSASSVTTEKHGDSIVITNQRAGLFDRTPLGTVVAMSWLVVLGTGAFGLWYGLGRRSIAIGVFMMIGFQAALHAVYGDPTFLYAPHVLPMLLVVAAGSWFTPFRWGALSLAVLIAAGGFVDNVEQFRKAAGIAAKVVQGGGNPVLDMYPAGGAVLP